MSAARRPLRRTSPDRSVDVALAEFDTLRAEIVSHLNAQAAVIGLGLTALGVIVGFTVKDGGSERLLLAIPPLALLVVLLHTAGSWRMALIGNYVWTELWPYLTKRVGDKGLPSWEGKVAKRQQPLKAIPIAVIIDFPAGVIFICASIGALLSIGDREILWFGGWLAVGFAIAVPTVVGLRVRKKSREDAEALEGKARPPRAAAGPRGCCRRGP